MSSAPGLVACYSLDASNCAPVVDHIEATFRGGTPKPRRDYAKFFDEAGLKLVEQSDWQTLTIGPLFVVCSLAIAPMQY